MRNLKRVLALALALIMTLGLMITASAASYPDADQIDAKYTEAIEVLSGLGVFKGQGNGGATNFAPKAILTRGEVATLVYRILTGDVTDAQIRNYDYTSFDDVLEGQWWTGYITYAANGGYVKGYDGHFYPQDEVTGVQVLAIMLRAIGRGQNGEYEGAAWKDNVLTDARDLGLLKGISTDDLDKGAARELVAQLLFNAITIPNIVTYSALLGYQVTPEKQTLGNKTFGLVRFDGVVTANEYADLYADRALAAGKTEIDNVVYNYSSDLTIIGESRQGWASGLGKTKTVVFIEETDRNNVLVDTGAATELDSKFEKANGITAATERFLNFGYGNTYTCDYLLTFGFLNEGEMDTDAEWQTVVKAGDPIQNINVLEDVFDDNDGYVYVGTKNTANGKDLSDTMTWKEFKAEYLNADPTDEIKSTENGEWLKVIDHDGDGKADYVLKTQFVLDVVVDVTKTGTEFGKIPTKGTEIVCDDDAAIDDVVIWTLIDGVYYVKAAESFTAQVKTYSWKNDEITTTDGDVYGQSGITNSDGKDACVDGKYADLVFTDLEDAADKTDYIFYTDFFGYVAAYDEVETSNGLLLLTDGYYSYGLNKKDTYQIEYWNSADESFDTAGVNTTASVSKDVYGHTVRINSFIDDGVNSDTDLNQGWERLIGAVNGAWTNVAAVSLNDDTATVKDVNAKSNKAFTYTLALDDTDGFTAKDKLLTADDASGTTVMTNSKTVFYYVYKYGKNMTVTAKVGFANSLDVPEADVHAAYAVVTSTSEYDSTAKNYPVADVVVIEVNNPVGATKDAVLLYSINLRNSTEIRELSTILDGASKTYQWDSTNSTWSDAQYKDLDVFTFQSLTLRSGKAVDANEITRYEANHIYAGTIDAINAIGNVDGDKYVYLVDGETVDINDETPILTFSVGSKNTYDVKTDNTLSVRNNGEKIIWVTDNKGNVTYIINVSRSTYKDADTNKDVVIDALDELWTDIVNEPTIPTELEGLLAAALTAATEKGSYTAYVAETVVSDGVTTAVDEINYSEALAVLAGLRAEKYADSAKAIAAADKLSAAIDTFINGLVAAENADIDAVVPAADTTAMADEIKDAKDAVADAAKTRTTATPADIAAAGDKAVEELAEAYAAAIKAAREEALEDLQDAKTEAMKLDDKYANGSLNSAITLAYEAAVKAVNGAETIAAIETAAEDGVDDIEAAVADWAAIDAAIDIIKETYSSGAGIGNTVAEAEQILSDATDVTVSSYTCTGTSPNFVLTATLTSNEAVKTITWNYTVTP